MAAAEASVTRTAKRNGHLMRCPFFCCLRASAPHEGKVYRPGDYDPIDRAATVVGHIKFAVPIFTETGDVKVGIYQKSGLPVFALSPRAPDTATAIIPIEVDALHAGMVFATIDEPARDAAAQRMVVFSNSK